MRKRFAPLNMADFCSNCTVRVLYVVRPDAGACFAGKMALARRSGDWPWVSPPIETTMAEPIPAFCAPCYRASLQLIRGSA
jgi:hypothetical protein